MNRQKSSEKNSTRTGTDMNFDSGTKSGQISRRTSERQGCGTDCVVCIKRESAVFTEAGKQHGYKKTALSYLSPWEELMQDVGKIKLTMNPEKRHWNEHGSG